MGGLLSAGDAGPARLRYGGLRDLVIGATIVLADGSVARSGGHVIKNVAGYDLCKLLHGSLGTLALIGEVVLRLHPTPPTRLTVVASADAEPALALAAAPVEPAALEWVSDSPGLAGELSVRVQGTHTVAETAARSVNTVLGALGIPARTSSSAAADARWARHEQAVSGRDGGVTMHINGLPSGLSALAAAVATHTDRADIEVAMVSAAGVGMHTVTLAPADPEQHAQVVTGIRAYTDGARCSVLLRRRPVALDAHVDVMGTSPPTVEILRRIKHEFDPDDRFAGWY